MGGMDRSVVREIEYPAEPLAPFRRLAGLPHAMALHSARTDLPFARYSYFSAEPCATLRLDHAGRWNATGLARRDLPDDPLRVLERLLGEGRAEPGPFRGGWVGYLAYELAGYIDGLPRHARPEPRTALLWLGCYDAVVVLDHHARRGWVVGREPRVERMAEWLREGACSQMGPMGRMGPMGPIEMEQSREFYYSRLAAIREHLWAGDIYQANYTQRVRVEGRFSAAGLFAAMAARNAAPFSAYLDCGDHAIVSASPELFLDFDGTTATTRPIKGTRPRGRTPEEDARLAAELSASPKDLAEHLMIVDLERNDLGRVCAAGSVRAYDMLSVESYASVHHLVSSVRGRLPADRGSAELLRALFPGGSVTGAPRRRAMQIIAELEPCPRGVYTGCIGWLDDSGRMQWNIAIRTLVVTPEEVCFHVGGGIVWDSDPEAEYEECRAKAAGLLWSLETHEYDS